MNADGSKAVLSRGNRAEKRVVGSVCVGDDKTTTWSEAERRSAKQTRACLLILVVQHVSGEDDVERIDVVAHTFAKRRRRNVDI